MNVETHLKHFCEMTAMKAHEVFACLDMDCKGSCYNTFLGPYNFFPSIAAVMGSFSL